MQLTYFTSGRRERVFDAVIQAGHRIEELVVTDPARWPNVRPTIELAQAAGVKVTTISRGDLEGLAASVAGKICLSVGFAYLFPLNVISSAKLMLNVHGTLLPKYGGARTGNWVIVNGEKESGVTVHAIDAGMDTGPILLQRKFPLDPFETAASLRLKIAEFEPAVVVEALSRLEDGTASLTPQPVNVESKWPDRTALHCELDPSRPLKDLVQEILACDPQHYPAFFRHKGRKVYVQIWPAQQDPLDDPAR